MFEREDQTDSGTKGGSRVPKKDCWTVTVGCWKSCCCFFPQVLAILSSHGGTLDWEIPIKSFSEIYRYVTWASRISKKGSTIHLITFPLKKKKKKNSQLFKSHSIWNFFQWRFLPCFSIRSVTLTTYKDGRHSGLQKKGSQNTGAAPLWLAVV